MEDKKIIEKRNAKERTPNDDEEVLKNNENKSDDKKAANDIDRAKG